MSQSPHRNVGSKRYADGWRAINLLIRSDGSWSGRERNKCFFNEGGGRFRDASFLAGLDFAGDGRSFTPLDLDLDGDLDLILQFRTAPGVRVLRNDLSGGAPRFRSNFWALKATATPSARGPRSRPTAAR